MIFVGKVLYRYEVNPAAQDYRRALEELNVQVSASLTELEQEIRFLGSHH